MTDPVTSSVRPQDDWARRAQELDAADPLRAFRDRFLTSGESDVIAYLDGQLAGPAARRHRRADGALRLRGVGGPPDPGLDRRLAGLAAVRG
ncbi:hypothetical protein GCM10018966_073150 [Streptomyces yanii]